MSTALRKDWLSQVINYTIQHENFGLVLAFSDRSQWVNTPVALRTEEQSVLKLCRFLSALKCAPADYSKPTEKIQTGALVNLHRLEQENDTGLTWDDNSPQ